MQAIQGENKSPNLRFIANTWLYMDVLTRLTSPNNQHGEFERITDFVSLLTTNNTRTSPGTADIHIDPLMGCADTLFPLIGRVTDLVDRLMAAIDRWTPSPSLSPPRPPPPATHCSISHAKHCPPPSGPSAISQTANAYKWATMLPLYQAVPELPCTLSDAELARQVLV
ncbi:hypothetical protein BJX64DRAFT_295321 [Aspergillus heterothallicus]